MWRPFPIYSLPNGQDRLEGMLTEIEKIIIFIATLQELPKAVSQQNHSRLRILDGISMRGQQQIDLTFLQIKQRRQACGHSFGAVVGPLCSRETHHFAR